MIWPRGSAAHGLIKYKATEKWHYVIMSRQVVLIGQLITSAEFLLVALIYDLQSSNPIITLENLWFSLNLLEKMGIHGQNLAI